MESRKSASSSDQDTLRSKLDSLSSIGVFSNYYTQILQRIFGDHAQGKIQVDGNGLQPRPDRKLAPRGRAMSAMATVVAFDLAAIMLSLSGRGNHPRFLLHDSPREGEMEMPLFSKVFEVACHVESYFNGSPGFQYIIATANAPSDYSVQSAKHECLVLNGRTDDGRLFKLKF